jgi:hypothetical protein
MHEMTAHINQLPWCGISRQVIGLGNNLINAACDQHNNHQTDEAGKGPLYNLTDHHNHPSTNREVQR